MSRLSFRVSGRVQGVGFRWFTQKAAAQQGVAGWGRNESDGSVCGEVQGDEAAVERFLAALRIGPKLGRVEDLHTERLDPLAAVRTDFEIR